MTTANKDYLTCVETAKLVRAALKRAFPAARFSVRSDTYAGGASIRVRWTDGPTVSEVEAIAKRYSGADFDGMIDLKYHYAHYLLPDGTVKWAKTYGHSYDNDEAVYTLDDFPEGTRLVHFGADYVFCDRDLSDEFEAELVAEIETATGLALNMNGENPGVYIGTVFGPDGESEFGPHLVMGGRAEWGYGLVHQLQTKRSKYEKKERSDDAA